ncbi:MAG: formate dehydrogenase accessory sulfurtransferase FdhD [Weeksellaceae bacterium]|nr:formate dehydrogenase accessory sulfurtransferase FdhD [Weeksellaceae bacterium]
MTPKSEKLPVNRFRDHNFTHELDSVVIEEPLEIRLVRKTGNQVENYSVAVTMRTPGEDLALAIGFLFTEGILHEPADVILQECVTYDNRVYVKLHPHTQIRPEQFQRNFYTTSSCGICGKASIEAISTEVAPNEYSQTIQLSTQQILQMSDKVREAQRTFHETGGLHASALLNDQLQVLQIMEDVGRHNALDKLIGEAWIQSDQNQSVRSNMSGKILFLSGRASFELLQKCAVAGISTVYCVGAPSTLAVSTAQQFDITLIGFLRQKSFNIYHQNSQFQLIET